MLLGGRSLNRSSWVPRMRRPWGSAAVAAAVAAAVGRHAAICLEYLYYRDSYSTQHLPLFPNGTVHSILESATSADPL